MTAKRPNPALWVYYQYRGKLPEKYQEWVLYDGTCRTWLLRVFVRSLVMVAPIVAALFAGFLLLGHSSWLLAVGSSVLALLVNLRFSLAYSEENVDARLARHGYPPGYGSAVRRARYEAAHAAETERYRVAYRSADE